MNPMALSRLLIAVILVAAAPMCFLDAAPPDLAVDTSFSGGSALVEKIDQSARFIKISPTVHQDRGWVCWWFFKLKGIKPGETITLEVGPAPWATPDRAAFSVDGKTWKQTAPGKRDKKQITYRQTIDATECWFVWGPPFTPAEAQALVDESAQASPFAKAFVLCQSRGGRPVPALHIEEPQPKGNKAGPRFGIWISARQHAWESGSSWVCRGLTEWLVSDDSRAVELRRKSRIDIVPIMDIDNVAIGAGGKEEKPQDHNRDWSEVPHWKAVAAAQATIRKQNEQGDFDLFLDLHNPDAGAKQPFFFVSPRDKMSEFQARNLDHFLAAVKLEMTEPLPIAKDTRESGPSYDKGWREISKNWVTFNCRPHVVSATLETAWNTPASTTEGYRTVGRQLGLAIERYLRTSPRQ